MHAQPSCEKPQVCHEGPQVTNEKSQVTREQPKHIQKTPHMTGKQPHITHQHPKNSNEGLKVLIKSSMNTTKCLKPIQKWSQVLSEMPVYKLKFSLFKQKRLQVSPEWSHEKINTNLLYFCILLTPISCLLSPQKY